MKYHQPFDQPTNPNAGYTDGNPSTGVNGSIPPAASIEFPQREIVAAIVSAGLTPSDADLTQLKEAIQLIDVCNVEKMATNTGSATAWIAAIPALPSSGIPVGTAFWFKPGIASAPGGTTLVFNGLGPNPVRQPDLSRVQLGDVPASSWLLLFWDGIEWLILVGAKPPNSISMLQANVNWYVSAAIGSDTLYDGTQATVSGAHGPFATIQRALQETRKYNQNNFSQTINVADGDYYGPVTLPNIIGSGTIALTGNPTTPANCRITGVGTDAINGGTGGGNEYAIDGFRISTTGSAGSGIYTGGGVNLRAIQFVPVVGVMLYATGGQGYFLIYGPITIESGANAQIFAAAQLGADIGNSGDSTEWPPIIIKGPVTFSNCFVSCNDASLQLTASLLSGAGYVTGCRYSVTANGVLNGGGGSATYWPGTIDGSASYGGQYI